MVHINKDLADSVMMLSFISLVLVGTTEFDDEAKKYVMMAILGGIAIVTVVFRILGARQSAGHTDTEDEA
ncbi:MAG: hypothetical protein LBQ78_04065 [Tannerellaceae bacterium]|jgi:hypothetical protein|nr:hypothetical protein [Tannerellaceae bacterium]